MNESHTPEPWHVRHPEPGAWHIVDDPEAPATIAILPAKAESEANARRIVAAVNACAGIATADLERMDPGELASAVGLVLAMGADEES